MYCERMYAFAYMYSRIIHNFESTNIHIYVKEYMLDIKRSIYIYMNIRMHILSLIRTYIHTNSYTKLDMHKNFEHCMQVCMTRQ